MSEWVSRASLLAGEAHAGQVDKAGRPYILHPAAVVESLPFIPEFLALSEEDREVALAAAWLHDTVEDTAVTLESLRAAGFPDRVVEVVDLLTHRRHEPRGDYYSRVLTDRVAVAVKVADVLHNGSEDRLAAVPDAADQMRLAEKYATALKVLRS